MNIPPKPNMHLQRGAKLALYKIDLRSRSRIEHFVNQFDVYSDFNFVSLYSWAVNGGSYYGMTEKGLYILIPDYVTQAYTPSFLIAPGHEDEISLFLETLADKHCSPVFKLIPEINIAGATRYLDNAGMSYVVSEDRGAFDYIIDTQKTAQAKGGSYADLRYKLAKFKREWGEKVARIDFAVHNTRHMEMALELSRKWSMQAEIDPGQSIYELEATRRFLELCRSISNVRFIAYTYEDRLVGLSSYEVLQGQKAIGHFLKYDRDFAGIYSVLVYESCMDLTRQGVGCINIEQDLGVEGMRNAKMHLRPTQFMKKYTLAVNAK